MIPLPNHLERRPDVLTCGEVIDILIFWNYCGSERSAQRFIEDMRECEQLLSVTPFPSGQRARYAIEDVLKLYRPNRCQVTPTEPRGSCKFGAREFKSAGALVAG